jgi:hypothetical protein
MGMYPIIYVTIWAYNLLGLHFKVSVILLFEDKKRRLKRRLASDYSVRDVISPHRISRSGPDLRIGPIRDAP